MNKAFIIKNISDLRARPDFRSERKSQLLFGEVVTVKGKQKGYCRVMQANGYTGWVKENALKPIDPGYRSKSPSGAIYKVIKKTARIISSNLKVAPEFVFYGSRFNRVAVRKNRAIIYLPNRLKITVRAANISRVNHFKTISGKSIIKEARRMLGSPYLWGGTTPFGYDCSGLVQMIFARYNLELPRDSKDQRKCGMLITRPDIRSGDLLFFPGHVAIAITASRFIHASLLEGGVSINNFERTSPLYRPDLDISFEFARRVLI